jgi:predicted phage terminase large subunit-like protein
MLASINNIDARCSLMTYAQRMVQDYRPGWMLEELCSRLEQFSDDVANRRSPRLAITMPPQFGKSMHCAELLPPWHLGQYPRHNAVVISYALSPARDRVRAARDIAVESKPIFPDLTISRATRAKVDWRLENARGRTLGGCLAVGIGGSLTGKQADFIVFDDPHKNWMDAFSPLKRDNVWDFFRSVAFTRLSPGGGILLIQTRWHEDDLWGRIQRETPDGWTFVELPAIALKDEYRADGSLARRKGEALHPERRSLAQLENIRASIGPYVWSSLYQCQPSSPGGSIWRRDWFKFWNHQHLNATQAEAGWRTRPDKFDQVVCSWDLTFGSMSKSASFVVGQVWGRQGEDCYLLEEWRRRAGFTESAKAIAQMAAKYPQAINLVEDKANGPAVLDHLRSKVPRLKPVKPDGSKSARMHACAAPIESGKVFLPNPAEQPWVNPWLAEVVSFPDSPNDDRCDAASQALRFLSKRPSLFFARRS